MAVLSFGQMFGQQGARLSTDSSDSVDTSVSLRKRIISDLVVIVGIIFLFSVIAWMLPDIGTPVDVRGIPSYVSSDLLSLPYYALRSVFRMFVALGFSLVFTFVYGLLAARSRRFGKILIMILDILQSVPILGFLSATITIWLALFPGSMLGVEAASIFAIFTSQAWNMAFSFCQSLLTEPKELDEASRSLRLTKWQRFWNLDVPHSMIPLLWNCMMSVGGGWFFLTASEMISVNNHTYALPGIGSFVAQAARERNTHAIVWAIVTMIVVVLLIDFFVWKPLTAWADKFRYTSSKSDTVKKSAVLTVIRQSHVDDMIGRLLRPVGDFLTKFTRIFGKTGAQWHVRTRRTMWFDVISILIVGVLSVYVLAELIVSIYENATFVELGEVTWLGVMTFLRVMLLTLLCSCVWVPVGAIIGMNPKIAQFIQPLVQVLASFPSNFTFPFVTLWFIAWHVDINWGSILLMSLGTQWYILFNVIAGASQIPDDLKEMTTSFQLNIWDRWRVLILPSVFSAWVTGGITAAGGAWNASIVSEIVSYGAHTLSAQGLGSYIAEATSQGNAVHALMGVMVMSIFVVVINRMFWHPLQELAARRFSLS